MEFCTLSRPEIPQRQPIPIVGCMDERLSLSSNTVLFGLAGSLTLAQAPPTREEMELQAVFS